MRNGSSKRFWRNGSTASSESGPPRLSKRTPVCGGAGRGRSGITRGFYPANAAPATVATAAPRGRSVADSSVRGLGAVGWADLWTRGDLGSAADLGAGADVRPGAAQRAGVAGVRDPTAVEDHAAVAAGSARRFLRRPAAGGRMASLRLRGRGLHRLREADARAPQDQS